MMYLISTEVGRSGLFLSGQSGGRFRHFLKQRRLLGALVFFATDVTDAGEAIEDQISPAEDISLLGSARAGQERG